jgi:hypothetical protein
MRSMTKRPDLPIAPAKSARTAPKPNPRLGRQTRKLLQKHYRAKHGVR